MSIWLRNGLAIVVGLILANVVNMAITVNAHRVVPPPPGADMTTVDGVRAALPRMSPEHFAMPFAAHALGTLTGGFVAAAIAVRRKMTMALVIGFIFFVFGAVMIGMVGGPLWFIVLDLVVAYVPTAWLGGRIGISLTTRPRPAMVS